MSAATCTDSWTSPTCNVRSMRARWLTSMTTPERAGALKGGRVGADAVVAGPHVGKDVIAALVGDSRILVSVLARVAVTRAFGTGAPDESVIVPWIREVDVCAKAMDEASRTRTTVREDDLGAARLEFSRAT